MCYIGGYINLYKDLVYNSTKVYNCITVGDIYYFAWYHIWYYQSFGERCLKKREKIKGRYIISLYMCIVIYKFKQKNVCDLWYIC